MISNPMTWFATGGNFSDQREFKYEGGTTLFHFSPHDSNLSRSMEMNVVFFANSVEHAKDVLKRLLAFRIECGNDHIKYQLSNGRQVHAEEFEEAYKRKSAYPQMLLDNEAKWVIVEAPMNQFYTVGWASNDTEM